MLRSGIAYCWFVAVCLFGLAACTEKQPVADTQAGTPESDPASIVNGVADRYYEFTLSRYPDASRTVTNRIVA